MSGADEVREVLREVRWPHAFIVAAVLAALVGSMFAPPACTFSTSSSETTTTTTEAKP